jgi:hypothetical protein
MGVHGSTTGVGDATVETLGMELAGLLQGSFYETDRIFCTCVVLIL